MIVDSNMMHYALYLAPHHHTEACLLAALSEGPDLRSAELSPGDVPHPLGDQRIPLHLRQLPGVY